jgi:hypothetical protein
MLVSACFFLYTKTPIKKNRNFSGGDVKKIKMIGEPCWSKQ